MSASSERLIDTFVLVILMLFIGWYAIDSYRASTHILNLILVLPVALTASFLCIIELVRGSRRTTTNTPSTDSIVGVLPMIGLFAAYVISLEWLGFDLGTFCFVSIWLYLRGERRWHWIISYSLAVAAITTIFFASILPYPMPLGLWPSEY